MIAGSTVLRILDRAAVMLSTAARARSFMAVRSLDRLPIPGIRPNHRLLSILGEPIHDNGPSRSFRTLTGKRGSVKPSVFGF